MGGADPFVLPIENVPTGELVAGAVALGIVLIFCWFLFGLLRVALKLLFGVVVTFLIAVSVLGACYTALVVMGTLRAYVPPRLLGQPALLVAGIVGLAALGFYHYVRPRRSRRRGDRTWEGALPLERPRAAGAPRVTLRERTVEYTPDGGERWPRPAAPGS